MTSSKHFDASSGWRRIARHALVLLPELAAFGGALLFAALGAVLVGSLGGCGGGVGSEGTGSFASSYGSGPISGFGSIVVNGVHYDERAASVADDDGQALDRSALALGMVVQVSGGAVGTAANGTLVATASSVRTARALVGPASAVEAAAGRLRVLGQAVLVTADTVLPDSLAGGLAGVVAGQVLEVYGFYDDSRAAYVATRIAPAAAAAGYRVSGPVASVDGSQSFTLGGQAFAGATAGLVPGAQLRLSVQPQQDGNGRWVVSTQRSDERPPDDRERAGLEGVVSALASANRFVVGGVTVDGSAARIEGSLQVGARVEVRGSLRAGVLVATEVKAAASGEARSFELKGTPSQLDTVARRFVVRGTPVSYARAGLVFKNGDAAKLVGFAGTLEVKGTLSADRTVLEATEIEFD
jgi:hypothetical protein